MPVGQARSLARRGVARPDGPPCSLSHLPPSLPCRSRSIPLDPLSPILFVDAAAAAYGAQAAGPGVLGWLRRSARSPTRGGRAARGRADGHVNISSACHVPSPVISTVSPPTHKSTPVRVAARGARARRRACPRVHAAARHPRTPGLGRCCVRAAAPPRYAARPGPHRPLEEERPAESREFDRWHGRPGQFPLFSQGFELFDLFQDFAV